LESDGQLCNRNGSLRVSKVRKYFGYDVESKEQIRELTDDDLEMLKGLYVRWRDLVELIPIKFVYRDNKVIISEDPEYLKKVLFFYDKHFGIQCSEYLDSLWIPTERNEWKFIYAVKRGNKQYVKMMRDKLRPLQQLPPMDYDPLKKTNMLYITGTVDPVCCGKDRGWLEFGSWWNEYITNLRVKYGKIEYLRAWQSQDNGRPHFHAVVVFKEKSFTMVPWTHPNGRRTLRLHSRSSDRKYIKNAWKYGFIDIVCVSDLRQAFKDLIKYVTRDLEGGASDLTNALVWYFGRQSFAISRGFFEHFGLKIDIAEPCNDDLINGIISNSKNDDLLRIEIYPTIPENLVRKQKIVTIFDFSDKDPPPHYFFDVDEIERLTVGYELVEKSYSKKLECPVFMWIESG